MKPLPSRYAMLAVWSERQGRLVGTAVDRVAGGIAVLKFAATGTEMAAELAAEGRLLADLEHPELVRVVGRFEGMPDPRDALAWPPVSGFSTRWVEGEPLAQALGASPMATRIAAYGGVLRAVDYLHRRGILHLDLKPDNICATEERVVLLDLGSARPLDAGPGTAGGTHGYAAPEVVAGHAASVASDIYSLGVVLYESLSGTLPWQGMPGAGRFGAPSATVPLRAVAPTTPRIISRLVHRMLDPDPVRRPAHILELMEHLRAAGFPVAAGPTGAPPLVGRKRALAALVSGWTLDGGTFVVVGQPGSGRRRLVGRALSLLSDEGVVVADLRDCAHPAAGMSALLGASLPEEAPDDPAGVPLGLDAVRRPQAKIAVHLGEYDAVHPDSRTELVALGRRLAAAGVRVFWTARTAFGEATPVPLPPLTLPELQRIGAFVRVPGDGRLAAAGERTGGWPGPFLHDLAPPPIRDGDLPAPARTLLDGLRTLPSGIPARVMEELSAQNPESLQLLRLQGAVFTAPNGVLHVDGCIAGPVAPALRPLVERLLGEEASQEPVWWALVAARVGRLELALTRLPAALRHVGRQRAEVMELCERLAAAGSAAARLALVELLLDGGDPEGAVRLLEGSGAKVGHLWVRALRHAGRLEAAELAAREAVRAPDPSRALWLEMAWCALARSDVPGAQDALAAAMAMDPDDRDGEGLRVRARIAADHLKRGVSSQDFDSLASEIVRRSDDAPVAAGVLDTLGRGWAKAGDLVRAERLFALGMRRADQTGDLRVGTGLRLNIANLLLARGDAEGARRAYAAASLMARSVASDAFRARVAYSRAELDLRLRRIPSARRHVAELAACLGEDAGAGSRARLAVLEAWCALEEEDWEGAAQTLLAIEEGSVKGGLASLHAMLLADALLGTGHPQRALAVLQGVPELPDPAARARRQTLLGRTHLALGRAHLDQAVDLLPDQPGSLQRGDVGEALLAHGGEDLDPATFGSRRVDLERAASMLRGNRSRHAASLRDRLLASPGVLLESVVALVETIHEPTAFAPALARLVAEALGAHRVLIMARLPGLGRQQTHRELSQEEAAGIGQEVLVLIREPGDVWHSDDAFADPALRKASETVRTFEIRSLVAVAIPHGGRCIGALYVDDNHCAGRFGPDDVLLLQRLAQAVGTVIGGLAAPAITLHEPVDVLGVLHADVEAAESLKDTLSMLQHHDEINLLITGPTGAGKTVLARRIAVELLGLTGLEEVTLHACTPERLVSTLQGTRRGDFTGAVDRPGAIGNAIRHRRALFLDEIQSLDHAGQQALLPLLELPTRRFGSLGGSTRSLEAPLFVILATNADVHDGRWAEYFRPDLWFRANQVTIDLPSLAERGRESIYRYLKQMLESHDLPGPEQVFDVDALGRVVGGAWPGNLRELWALAMRAAALYRSLGRRLEVGDLARTGVPVHDLASDAPDSLHQVQRSAVLAALEESGWVQARAARRLGLTRWSLRRLLQRHGLLDEVSELRDAARRTRATEARPPGSNASEPDGA